MSQSRLNYLFHAYFNKTATANERDELMELLAQSNSDEQVKELLTQTWQQFSSQTNLFSDSQGVEMLSNILRKQTAEVSAPVIELNKNSRSFKWLRIAAAILIVAAGAIGIWLPNKKEQPQIALVKKIMPQASTPITAGGNKATLTLADGSTIILDSIHRGTLTKQGDVNIIKVNTATLAYNAGNENSDEVVYNTLSTPNGGQYQLILPDGSKVWLNASSSIRFPTIFKGKVRDVTVTGEVYFEVAKNAAMPFKVSAKDMIVEVLGTHFDVMAYDDESSMNTTLLEGSVKISKGGLKKMLLPGQQSIVNTGGDMNIKDADIEEVMAWKNGWFQFNASDIKMVMRQISRWYNVEIVYEGKIPEGHFTGMVNRENDIFQVLKIMQSGGVRFKIEGRKVFVLS